MPGMRLAAHVGHVVELDLVDDGDASAPVSSYSGHDAAPVSASTSRSSLSIGRSRPRPTIRASASASAGTTQSSSGMTPTIGAMPGTRRIEPSSPSSPTNARLADGVDRDHLERHEQPDRDRQVEARAGLAVRRRREVDRDLLVGPREAATS